MEYIFLLISIAITVGVLYGILRIIYPTHKAIVRSYNNAGTVLLDLLVALMIAMTIFILLAAINNSIWHIPYHSFN
jgi:hypothetical protein